MSELKVRVHRPISSAIRALGYNRSKRALVVRFSSGTDYLYLGVHPHRFTALRKTESVGEFIATYIKPNYVGVRLDRAASPLS